ncbi:mRNA splicing protein prp28 [Mycoemilia scoparia]|uniref:RNA helicase n=1 Tax=Mycoemilia scoparia TaxID=417184 RepID=A0A9W8A0P5_9FUNG|nr:mRNA splicing protein prp28 [Mycoemilia scoparia]
MSSESLSKRHSRDISPSQDGSTNSRSKVPLSVDELLKIKRENEQKKPVFLTKKQRAEEALKRRQKEAEEQRKLREEEMKEAKKVFEHRESSRDRGYHRQSRIERVDSRDRRHRRDSSRDRDRYGDRDDRDKRRNRRDPSRDRHRNRSRSPPHDGLSSRELMIIKEQYLGKQDKEKQKNRKQNDKKFVFDWDEREDTSKDYNDLYARRHELQLFGRGHIAGFDINEQMSKRSERFTRALMEKRDRRDYERSSRRDRDLSSRKVHEKGKKWDDRHWSEKPLNDMTERDWRIFKEDFSISTKGGSIPKPIRSWPESQIPKEILRVISDVGYEEPTPIQRQTIPIGLQGRDVIGIAETGSGKTASFLIPMLSYIMRLPKLDERNMSDGPYALILAPTRELAQQIESETQKFTKLLNYTCVSIVGGHSMEGQSFALRNGAEIIIATPGRLRDCIDRHILVLNQCSCVVMDEADRMIDMGFEADVNFILDALPSRELKKRQTTMFSATMPPLVEKLAKNYLVQPAIITIGTAGKAVDTVDQRVEFVTSDEKKRQRLLELVARFAPPMIVFVNQKKNVDLISHFVNTNGFNSVSLHGGKNQEQRELALGKLKKGEADILVATDVAGRGIDVKDVSLVINYDMAKNIEEYTHRIGRTGRAGKEGTAHTFLTPEDSGVFYDLKKMLMSSPLSRCPPELANHEAAQAPAASWGKQAIQL